MSNPFTFFSPATAEDFDDTRKIFTEYQQFLNVDLCFQSFDDELKNLDIVYKKPKGTIILVKSTHEIVASIALKPIEQNNCEMKRLYVKPSFRGLGLANKLVELIIQFAIENNYDIMKLDTLKRLTEAIALYRKFDFYETKPYVYNPLDDVLYFERKLR